MITEILWIKPKLKAGDAAAMEASLSTRFTKVAKKFGHGLRSVIKGTVFGIGLGLLAKLLNPLQDLEEKIRTLLGQGTDIGDLASRLGTNPGALKRTEDVANSFGIKPDEFKDLVTHFADTVETARKEFDHPFEERSSATKTLGEKLAREPDILKSFVAFNKKLQDERNGPGRTVQNGNGETRQVTGAQNAAEAEKLVFGGQQFGRFAEFLASDFEKRAKSLNLPSEQKTGESVQRLLKAGSQADVFRASNQANNFVKSADAVNLEMVRRLEGLDAKEQENLTKKLSKSFNDLASAKDGLTTISQFVEQIQTPILKIIGELPLLIDDLHSITSWTRKGPKR